MAKILIDPGHSPTATGNRGQTGYFEYAGMWKLSNYLKVALERCGATVMLSRAENEDPAIEARGRLAQGCDLFIAEHSNAANQIARGVECWYSVNRSGDRAFAAALSAAVALIMSNPDRGAKQGSIEGTTVDYGQIRGAVAVGVPHALLIENGFHDNLQDEAVLKVDNNLQIMAEAQAQVICAHLAMKYVVPGTTAAPGSSIMGQSALTPTVMAAFLLGTNSAPSISCSPLELATYYVEEGAVLGVRGDIAFCQAIHETGLWKFGGSVKPEQNNFAGIGAVSATVGGASFDTPRIGVRAQIQHLFAYASKETLPAGVTLVDPRFSLVTRGVAPNWQDLNGRWAVPGTGYGEAILAHYEKMKLFAATFPIKEETPTHWAQGALNDLVAAGVIASPEVWTNWDEPASKAQVLSIAAKLLKAR